jgi:hypothetical protein
MLEILFRKFSCIILSNATLYSNFGGEFSRHMHIYFEEHQYVPIHPVGNVVVHGNFKYMS